MSHDRFRPKGQAGSSGYSSVSRPETAVTKRFIVSLMGSPSLQIPLSISALVNQRLPGPWILHKADSSLSSTPASS